MFSIGFPNKIDITAFKCPRFFSNVLLHLR
jgi:hypothetical protein